MQEGFRPHATDIAGLMVVFMTLRFKRKQRILPNCRDLRIRPPLLTIPACPWHPAFPLCLFFILQERGTVPFFGGPPVLNNRRRSLPLHRDVIDLLYRVSRANVVVSGVLVSTAVGAGVLAVGCPKHSTHVARVVASTGRRPAATACVAVA